jgi:hypothetical protein
MRNLSWLAHLRSLHVTAFVILITLKVKKGKVKSKYLWHHIMGNELSSCSHDHVFLIQELSIDTFSDFLIVVVYKSSQMSALS